MLDVYYDVSLELSKTHPNNKSMFYISDKKHFSKFAKKNDKFTASYKYICEWEITDKVKNSFDINKLISLEEKYFKDKSIWEPLIADRRVFMGKLSKYTQDYSPTFSYNEMMSLIIYSVELIEDFFKSYKPDIVVGFTVATFGEYLIALIAKKRGIKFVQLRHTKINNYYTFSSDLHEEYNIIRNTFRLKDKISSNEHVVNSYISGIKKKGMVYEGTVSYGDNLKDVVSNYPKYLLISLINDIRYFSIKSDNHYMVSFSKIFLYDKVYRYIKNVYQSVALSRYYVKDDLLDEEKRIFFPLHAEPEIAISIFSIFYQNQIEVIRNIAMSLPAGYKLTVKEHPRNIGRRSMNYYKKILQIPNVDLADPYRNPSSIISKSKLVIVLNGFLGFEALMSKVPVISLGNTMFNMLPKKMVNHVNNIKDIRSEIVFSLNNFVYDEQVIKEYLHAILFNSTKLDLYTVLLKKVGRKGGSSYSTDLYMKNISSLANLLLRELPLCQDSCPVS